MWIIYQGVEERKGVLSQSGKPYDCWVMSGIKKGFGQNDEDKPYEKVLFDSTAITVIEKGLNRNGMSLLQFLQKACKPGDLLVVKSERDRNGIWRWTQIENKTVDLPTYEPLPDGNIQAPAAPAFTPEPPVTESIPSEYRRPF